MDDKIVTNAWEILDQITDKMLSNAYKLTELMPKNLEWDHAVTNLEVSLQEYRTWRAVVDYVDYVDYVGQETL